MFHVKQKHKQEVVLVRSFLFKIDVEIFVLLFSHESDIRLGFIFKTAEMKDAMKNDTMEFFPEAGIQVRGVFPDSLYADIDFPDKRLAGSWQGETQDIGIIIMLQKLHIQTEQGFVIAKDKQNAFQGPFFLFEYGNDEAF